MSENKSTSLNLSATQFFEVLAKSQIVSTDKLNAIARQLKKAGTNVSTDKLVDSLIKAGLITQWQSQKLINGRYKGFFLGKYKLLGHLGTGGMSTVYLAQQTLTGQQRAIKVLPRKKLNDRSYLPRFYNEARAIAVLNHPNIIRIFDINHQDDTHYMVMEYVEGCDLYDEVVDNGPVNFELARDCVIQSAEGLDHAHQQQLIHRDIKPANLFRTESGIIKVLDLGLALLKSDDEEHGLSKQFNENTMGTADYLSPEQAINSHEVDHRTDIYSLGCTLYFLLTGQPPFNEGTLAQRIAKHQTIMPEKVSKLRPDCPAGLQDICMRMMAKDPNDRFTNCRELIAALNNKEDWQPEAKISINTTTMSVAKTKPESFKATQTKRKKFPWLMVTSLLVLLAIPVTLASYLLISNNETDPKTSTSNSTSISPNQQQPPAVESGLQPNDAPATPVASGTVDFENRVGFGDSRSGWDLSKFSLAGELRSEGHSRIVKSPNGHLEQIGPHVLRIRGNSKQVEFIPYDKKNSKLQKIEFQAMRESSDSLDVAIDAKSTIQSERWQEIAVLTQQVNAQGFSEVLITKELLNKIPNPQKFRFRIGGSKDSGIFVDHLKIEFQ